MGGQSVNLAFAPTHLFRSSSCQRQENVRSARVIGWLLHGVGQLESKFLEGEDRGEVLLRYAAGLVPGRGKPAAAGKLRPARLELKALLSVITWIMPVTLDPPALTVDRLQEALRIRRRIDQLERRLRALFSARRESKRNSYGLSGEEMSKIGANLHARAKERITSGRSKAFTDSIEEIL
jgi:hypothetical protein